MKKPLAGCVLCRDCHSCISPHPNGVLTAKDMVKLGYSGCSLGNSNRLIEAVRKCLNYTGAINNV